MPDRHAWSLLLVLVALVVVGPRTPAAGQEPPPDPTSTESTRAQAVHPEPAPGSPDERVTGTTAGGASRQPAAAPSPAAAGTSRSAAGVSLPLQTAEIDSLRALLQARFQVYPVPNGILLVPKYGAAGVQSVQVAGGLVALNGRTASGGEIASSLGPDAPLVLRLSYLSPEDLTNVASGAAAGPGPAGIDTLATPRLPSTGGITDADTAGVPPAVAGGRVPARPRTPVPPRPTPPGTAERPGDEEGPDDLPSGDIVRMGSDIAVPEGQTVTGDVVAIGGDLDVAGHVLGDVVSIGGVLRLRDSAVVNGDAAAVGGRLEKAPGATVMGRASNVSVSVPFFVGPRVHWEHDGIFPAVGGLLFTVLWIGLLLLIGAIFILFLGRPLDRVETNLRSSPLKAGVVGFFAQLLFLPIFLITFLLLTITIIGIPLAILWLTVVPLVAFVAALFGFTAAARAAGHFVSARMDRPLHSPYVALFLGLIVLYLPFLVSRVFDLGGGLMDLFSIGFLVLGSLVLYVAFTIGFGGVILTRFGTRTTWSGEPPGGQPAPVSPGPPPPVPEPGPEPALRSSPESAATRPLPPSPVGRLVQGPAVAEGNEGLPPG